MDRRMVRAAALFSLAVLILSCAAERPAVREGLVAGEGYIDVVGGRVWYEIVGSGTATPLLLLHGGPGATSFYLKPLSRLASDRPVIFYDQLGCGRSDRPEDTGLWNVERFVEELEQVRRALDLERVHIFGHSWGSTLAVEYVLGNSTGVESLILAGPALSTQQWMEDANKLRAELPIKTQEILRRHEAAGTTDSEEYAAATMEFYKRHFCRLDPWPPELEQTLDNFGWDVYTKMWGPSDFFATGTLKEFDRTDRLAEIEIPTLLTAGRHDEATPETTAWYQSLIPGSSLEIFEESSHMTMLEEPDRYLEVVRDFLQSVEAGSNE